MKQAKRIENLPPYLFAELDRKIALKRDEGVDVISLGIGDPCEPTPQHIIDTLCREAHNPKHHRYPSYYGMPEFRRAIAGWYERRFGLSFDSNTEVLPLIGSKEGIAHIHTAYVDPGDIVLVPDPGYPVYNSGTILAGGVSYFMPLTAENDFLPDLEAIPGDVADKAKLMFLNYPNNPTAAVATEDFFKRVVEFAKSHNIVIAHDFPYSEITFDGYRAPSFMATPGAKDVAVEFHSLSKTYNMTGWRIGWVLGNPAVIEALGRVKSNIDSGIFNAIQEAGIVALEGPQDCVDEMCHIYRRRRDLVINTLSDLGIKIEPPKATIYIWFRVPQGHTSASFAEMVLDKAGVAMPPGSGYGPSGEGYARISLTVPDDRLKEALDRMAQTL
ncbi:MAG: LL-diaminopimelate aminotransferase [Actinomycetota bacterium]|nr:LL-diaminopimelate aminotransferase [Actinomycetota bacterium]